jgi:hypothetical protein
MFVLESRLFRKIFDGLLVLFLQNERGELRADAVKLVRMLIPIIWDDFGDFFKEAVDQETRPLVAAANAAALIGAVIIINQAPSWLQALLEFLKSAHTKTRAYSSMISQETAQFWKKIGSRSIPEIDDFRIAFSGGYFT